MKLLLNIHFNSSFMEICLPVVNNKAHRIEIPPDISGSSGVIVLELEVWNGDWFLLGGDGIEMTVEKGLREKIPLVPASVINCLAKGLNASFTIVVDEVNPQYTEFSKFSTGEKPISIGRSGDNAVCFNHRFVSSYHAVLEPQGSGGCIIRDSNSSNGTYVNGKRIFGSCGLHFGDTVFILGLKIVYLGGVIAVNNPGGMASVNGLSPYETFQGQSAAGSDAQDSDAYYSRSPRQIVRLNDDVIDIEGPPAPNQQRKQPLLFTIGPAFTMIIPMAAGVFFTTMSAQNGNAMTSPFMFMGIVTSVTAAFIGIFWALANYRYVRKSAKSDEERRCALYEKYLARMKEEIQKIHFANRQKLMTLYPFTFECMSWAAPATRSRRLWERSGNHPDFLNVRLGMGEIKSPNPVTVPKERFTLIDDKLAGEPRKIRDEFLALRDAPVCISLYDYKLIGVIGSRRSDLLETARILSVQIASQHSYTDVRMAYLFPESERNEWNFTQWLPHTWSPDGKLRMLADDPIGAGEVLYCLSDILRQRTDAERKLREDSKPLPHYIVFIADPSLVENEAVMKYFAAPTREMGVTVIMLYGRIDRLPNACPVIIRNDPDAKGFYSLEDAFESVMNVNFDSADLPGVELFARNLSGVRVREPQSGGAIPQMLSFLDMYKTSSAEAIDVYRKWLENRTFESMRAMIGCKSGNIPLFLDIHEKHHGPHGLVAGTTGSGKSETLQTYILSLAVNYHPHEISFILIDYKGGGMAGSFRDLPHVVGIITNLGGNQTNRALVSINSEIKRRQAVFLEHDVKHIDMYIELYRSGRARDPIPHLIIITDEFAELKKEKPEFVRELVSASRIGRSLGVHLILATQKPSGVVDDEIWGNSKFRLCLRVQDKQDSNEMLKKADAAYITNIGRGFFQVGNDEIFEEFQSGWSGAGYEPGKPFMEDGMFAARMINLWGKPCVLAAAKNNAKAAGIAYEGDPEKKKTQLEAVVEHIQRVAREKGITPLGNIWLPPLPDSLCLEDIPVFRENSMSLSEGYREDDWEINPIIGLADDPANQRRIPLGIHFVRDGHLLIAGSGGGGKSTCLQTILFSAASCYSPNQVHIYIADFGSRVMGVFNLLPHVGGVVFEDDTDGADKLTAMLVKELASRKIRFSEKGIGSYREYVRVAKDTPAILFAIDNFTGFMENCPKQEENLILLSREAASYGIYLLVTCANVSDVKGKIRQNLTNGIGLQLSDKYEYEAAIGGKAEMTAEPKTPGRGLCKYPKPFEFQTALCLKASDTIAVNAEMKERFTAIAENWKGACARKIPQVPKDLSWQACEKREEMARALSSDRFLPLGYDPDDAELKCLDLGKLFCFSVGGHDRSGKTNALKTLMKASGLKDASLYLLDNASGDLESFSHEIGASGYFTDADSLYDFLQNVLLPEFTRRNKSKAAFTADGALDRDAYMEAHKKIFFFIHDLGYLCDLVYSSRKDMKSFLELMLVKGDFHMIYLFACIPSSAHSTYQSRPVYRNFINWKEGIHFGGLIDQQRILDLEAPLLERSKKMAPGTGLIGSDGKTRKIIVPYL